MSTDDTKSSDEVCASCGIAGVDNVKLKKCACFLVKYCSVDCQKNDRSRHKKACKKRLAELHDKKLFTQPDISHMGECPICCLPLSIYADKSILMSCCSKRMCKGCDHAYHMREIEGGLQYRCAFCRNPEAKSDDEHNKREMERVKKNDTAAMTQIGKKRYHEGNYEEALEYLTKAAELGDVAAHFCLGSLYESGDGVEKDMKRAVHHWEQAAIGGHPFARGLLGFHEMENGRMERAAKHYIIAANLGCNDNLQQVKELFVKGVVGKEEYAAALRGHQAAVNATKSAEREAAEAYYKAREAGTAAEERDKAEA